MTRETYAFKYIAITLCILLALTSWGTFVCVSGDSDHDTQFFAVNFYLAFAPKVPHSLSSDTGIRVVSWMKKSEIFPDNPTLAPAKSVSLNRFSDKHQSGGNRALSDIYTFFKSTSFFMRI